MIIAMDGPAGTGKSTIASLIAKKLNITYLNSGSFYRALTMALNETEIELSDEKAVLDFCKKQSLDYQNSHLMRYVTYKGTKWKIASMTDGYPRIIISLGGVYNGPEPESSEAPNP